MFVTRQSLSGDVSDVTTGSAWHELGTPEGMTTTRGGETDLLEGSLLTFDLDRREVLGGLCEHLRHIGVKSTLLDPDSSEAFTTPLGPTPHYINPISELGCVRIEDRNLDMMVVQRTDQNNLDNHGLISRVTMVYSYYYVVKLDVDGLTAADFDPGWPGRCCLRKSFKHHRCHRCGAVIGDDWNFCRTCGLDLEAQRLYAISGARWEGGGLAKLLNFESVLPRLLYEEGVDRLKVRCEKDLRCMRILHIPCHVHIPYHGHCYDYIGTDDHRQVLVDSVPVPAEQLGKEQFPSNRVFEAYDKIAQIMRTSFRETQLTTISRRHSFAGMQDTT